MDPQISIRTSDDFEPSEELRAAIQRVVELSEKTTNSGDAEAEVEGFRALRIGSVDVGKLETRTSWNDGCWGYSSSEKGGSCGWYQDSDLETSCVGYSWGD